MTFFRLFIFFTLFVFINTQGGQGQLLFKGAGLPPNVDLNNEPPADDETEASNLTPFASSNEIDLEVAKISKKVKTLPDVLLYIPVSLSYFSVSSAY